MSHDPYLPNHATSENLYAADEGYPGIISTLDHDDAFESQTQAWPPTSSIDELTSTSHAYSGYLYPDHNSTTNFSSLDSIGGIDHSERDQGLGDWQHGTSQAGSFVDPALLGTCGSHGFELPAFPLWGPQGSEPLDSLLPTTQDREQPPWSVYHAADQSYVASYHLGENSSGAAAQVDMSDLDRMTSSTSLATTAHGQNFRDVLGMPMRHLNTFARDAWSLIQSSPADIGKSEEHLDTPSRSSASVRMALICPHCGVRFSGTYSRGNLGRHVRHQHARPRKIVCEAPLCLKEFKRQDARLKHYRTSHPELVRDIVPSQSDGGGARSRYCVNGTDDNSDKERGLVSTTSALPSGERHLNDDAMDFASSAETTHKVEKSLRCSDCQIMFNRTADLRRHMAAFHDPDPPQYVCAIPGCDRASKPFSRKDKYMDHMKAVHSPSTTLAHSKSYQPKCTCPEQGCGREFDYNADLLRHQRTHTDMSERPHKCGQCEKSFLYPKDLKRHEATHLGDQDEEKPSFRCSVTSCEYCPRGSGFSRKDVMLRHMKRFHPDWKKAKEED
ncbi:hypothetical protein BKA58DRAFT_377290 [Alternaria rosae]|uniref:uncharacterized protein n=1 Tax=Alternaria rosae TaxID=1187941 RepID=UPI001E8E929E|nr:uncharacterized protein BKA58DRAFT_377290 [Alternaria rosae]KAH6878463.1 hypothetical protein BKA58DRAFT_377290 [Alternaria rosae]